MLSQRAPYLKWLTIVIPIFKCRNGNGAVSLNISKDFDRVWHAAFYHKLRFYGGWGHIFGLILPFSSNRRLLTIFLLHINDLADIICNIATMVMILLYTLRKGRCKTASSQLCVC